MSKTDDGSSGRDIYSEIEVILSEKRTALSTLRTGIAIFALPLSVLSVLVVTSKYYTVSEAGSLLFPLLILSAIMVALGLYLVVRAMLQIRRHDRQIARIKKQHSVVATLLD